MTLSATERARRVRQVLWIVLALNLAVTITKIIVGLLSGALSVVADGFHSVVDSSSNIIGLFGVWVSARPADANHPYGHQKYENIATLAIGGMLLVAAVEIGNNVVARLAGQQTEPEISWVTIAVMAGTFVINIGITLYETRAGRQLRSDILLADAAHTRTDLFVTLSVIASLIGGRLGFRWLDPVVAGGVVVLLVRAAIEILRSASNVLTDVAVVDPEKVRQVASGVPGVEQVAAVRSRGRTDAIYLDLNVRVNPAMDTDQAHALVTEVEHRLNIALPDLIDTVVHVEPAQPPHPSSALTDMALKLRALADGLGVGMHDLHVHAEREGGYSAEMHVEVNAGLSLGAAHQLVDDFENRARQLLPDLRWIVTHIEPLPTYLQAEQNDDERQKRIAALKEQVTTLADGVAGAETCHSVLVHNIDGDLTVTLHLTQPADLPLVQAHATAETVERMLYNQLPHLHRVVIHVEPPPA